MNNRWFIPIALAAFAILVVALRAYLVSGDDLSHTQIAGRQSDDTALPEPNGSPGAAPTADVSGKSAGEASRRLDRRRIAGRNSAPATGRWAQVSWRQLGAHLARRVDDTAVRLRSNLTGTAFIQCAQGWADMQADDHAAAVEHFDRALARRPDHVPALSAKAAALVALDRFDEAAVLYADVVRRAPEGTAARYNYGVLLYRQAKFAEATQQFRELVCIDPNHARGQYNLATLAQRAGRISEARDAWEAFTRLEPDIASAWFNLGVVQMDFDAPLAAARCFDRFVGLVPDDPDGWLNLGLAYVSAGHLYAALDALTTAEGLAPCNAAILRHLADLHTLLAEQGGRDADHHRQLAALLQEQAEADEEDAPASHAVAAAPAEDRE
ncbi:MAG: tetratricopeptide repeat protein [Phycisphaerae bacterium]|nr:tetratricopeptide repeat protein [Phycisphaerae bacterium]